jgi:hypothetical protein
MLRPSFTAHPASIGESYGEHFRSACTFSAHMIFGGIACLVHAIFPFFFVTTGSSTVRKLYERMVNNRNRIPFDGTKESATPSFEAVPEDDAQHKSAPAEKRQA